MKTSSRKCTFTTSIHIILLLCLLVFCFSAFAQAAPDPMLEDQEIEHPSLHELSVKSSLLFFPIKMDTHSSNKSSSSFKTNQNGIMALGFGALRKKNMKYSFLDLQKESFYLPDSVFFSWPGNNQTTGTYIYGFSFRPISLHLFAPKNDFGLQSSIGLSLTYAHIFVKDEAEQSGQQSKSMHFLRPALDASMEFRLPIKWTPDRNTRSGLSLGFTSQVYLPQKMWASVTEVEAEQSLWHVEQIWTRWYFYR